MLGLTFYLDDSGSDDGSSLVTCGGVAMSRLNSKEFADRWQRMYARNQFSGFALEPPLHMTDFVGMGKYAGLYPEFKRHLFLDVAKLINDHKLYSIGVAVSQEDFASAISPDVRVGLIGPYAFAFFAIIVAHQHFSKTLKCGPLRCHYVIDRGFGRQEQLEEAHDVISRFERATSDFSHTGKLRTDTDDALPALQAADAIAWVSRRLELNGFLPQGFEPLCEVLREDARPPHGRLRMPAESIKELAAPINNWINREGSLPRLQDIMSREFRGVNVRLK